MKYPFPVKHNGIDYEPGQEVPIGQEPVKENADKERTINEIREELIKLKYLIPDNYQYEKSLAKNKHSC